MSMKYYMNQNVFIMCMAQMKKYYPPKETMENVYNNGNKSKNAKTVLSCIYTHMNWFLFINNN